MARIWDRGGNLRDDLQCPRRARQGEYCTQHRKMLEKSGQLKHGRINEDVPPGMRSKMEKQRIAVVNG